MISTNQIAYFKRSAVFFKMTKVVQMKKKPGDTPSVTLTSVPYQSTEVLKCGSLVSRIKLKLKFDRRRKKARGRGRRVASFFGGFSLLLQRKKYSV